MNDLRGMTEVLNKIQFFVEENFSTFTSVNDVRSAAAEKFGTMFEDYAVTYYKDTCNEMTAHYEECHNISEYEELVKEINAQIQF